VLTGRAWAVLASGLALWLTSRLLGTPDVHMVAVGLLALIPFAAVLVRFMRHDLTAVRRLSTRRAFPGTRVNVEIEVRNLGKRRTAMLLIEDRVPSSVGPPARGVLGEIRAGTRGHVRYELTPRARGRYRVGPLSVLVSDPFDLVRKRIDFDVHHDLVVFPEIESIASRRPATPLGGAGEASTRQLYRAAEEFYTMRAYEEGDDLRRIHWPSVARTGELMIRQDESAHRAAASVFLDNRSSGLGGGGPAFERAVSAAASIGALYLRTGFRVRLATADRPPTVMDLDRFLETLALARPSRAHQVTPTLQRLAASSSGAGALVVVTHVPDAAAIAALTRLTTGGGSKIAVLVRPHEPDDLTIGARHQLETALQAARGSLGRAGWEVIPLRPNERLEEAWPRRRGRSPMAIAGSS
jgi:uncharacterized protein (DUF58 family)